LADELGDEGSGEYASIRQNEELRNKLRLTADEVYSQADNITRSTWQNLFVARTAIANGKAQVTADQLANEGATEEQRARGRTVLDTLNAKQALAGARLGARRDAQFVRSDLYALSAMGQLTARQRG
jgi:hypothetical protein